MIAAAVPADACSPLQNAPQLAGTIVLIDERGDECPLADRVLRAQSLAALAVIFVSGSNAAAVELVNITIPVVRLDSTAQATLSSHLGQRGAMSVGKGSFLCAL